MAILEGRAERGAERQKSMIAINLIRLAKSVCSLLMFLVMELIAYCFAAIAKESDDTIDKVFGVMFAVLFFLFALAIFY